jgi:hypothetical protein
VLERRKELWHLGVSTSETPSIPLFPEFPGDEEENGVVSPSFAPGPVLFPSSPPIQDGGGRHGDHLLLQCGGHVPPDLLGEGATDN